MVRLLFPDTQLLMPADDDEWTCLLSAIKAQLDTKLANIEKLTVPPPPKPETAKEKAEEPAENGAEKKDEEPKAESAKVVHQKEIVKQSTLDESRFFGERVIFET